MKSVSEGRVKSVSDGRVKSVSEGASVKKTMARGYNRLVSGKYT